MNRLFWIIFKSEAASRGMERAVLGVKRDTEFRPPLSPVVLRVGVGPLYAYIPAQGQEPN